MHQAAARLAVAALVVLVAQLAWAQTAATQATTDPDPAAKSEAVAPVAAPVASSAEDKTVAASKTQSPT